MIAHSTSNFLEFYIDPCMLEYTLICQNIQYRGKSSLQQLPGGKCNFFVRFCYLLKMHSMHSHWNSRFPTFLQDSSHSCSVYIFSIETRTLKWYLMCSFKLCTVWEGGVIFFTVPNSWIFLLLK